MNCAALQRQLDELLARTGAARATAAAGPAAAAGATARDYETVLDAATAFERWLATLAQRPSWSPSIPKRRASITCAAELVGLSFAVEPGRAAYVPGGTRLPRRAGATGRDEVLGALGTGSRTRRAKSATTSSTTRTCSRATASRCAACATTRCSNPMCSTAWRRATTWTRPRAITSASRPSVSRTSRGKGAKQITFNKVALEPGRATRPKMRTSRCACTARCGRCSAESPSLKRVYQEIEKPLVPVLLRHGSKPAC